MFFGTNSEHARALNRRGVFDAVRRHERVTRADVARSTGLSQQSVSNIVGELEEAGLVRAEGRRLGGRGQPGIELSVNPGGGYAIGLHVGHRRLTAVLVDLSGRVVQEIRRELPTPTPDAYGPVIAGAVDALLAAAGLQRDRVWGVGCVLPGLIEHGALTFMSPTVRGQWQNFPITRWLQNLLGLPVIVENDATAAAIGEQLYGVGRTVRDFFYIHFGLGVGGGMVLGGQSYRGAQGRAGRLGHMIVKPGGRLCTCGNRGCLEQYVSLFAALDAIAGPERSHEQVDPAELVARLAAADGQLLAWIDQAAAHLRFAVHTLETLFDTEVIVLGGEMPAPVLDALLARLEPLLPNVSRRGSATSGRVAKAATLSDMPALGATALPIARVIQPDLSLIWDGGPAAEEAPGPVFGGPALAGLFTRA